MCEMAGGEGRPSRSRGTRRLDRASLTGRQYPTLVGWNGYPADLRDRLSQADFGSALLGVGDGQFKAHPAKAKPSAIPFDPNA